MAYYRVCDDRKILVTANFGKEAVELNLENPVKQIILSNLSSDLTDTLKEKKQIQEKKLKLESCEVIVLECDLH